MIVELERRGRWLVGSGMKQEWRRLDSISAGKRVSVMSVKALQLHRRQLADQERRKS